MARLAALGLRTPAGFCVTTAAYESFVSASRLGETVAVELGRKPLEAMRWEELWDAALRIRTAFLRAPVPVEVLAQARDACRRLRPPFAVRSSAPGEDAAGASFAGLHETVLDVEPEGVEDALRVVWSSLWSDAALLYRRELGLDAARSRMAVVVQELARGARSGVAFGRDPRSRELEREVVEAVRGRCADLVDGKTEPDRWIMDRANGRVLDWRPAAAGAEPVLSDAQLSQVHGALERVRSGLGFDPDLEWTLDEALTLLQARPITPPAPAADKRAWYLSLRLSPERLRRLRTKVAEELLPELEREGARLAREDLAGLDAGGLAAAIDARLEAVRRWRGVYERDLIPFAHGVRSFAVYYASLLRPRDPFEFTELLRGESFLAAKRDAALEALAEGLRGDAALRAAVERGGLEAAAPGWAGKFRELLREAFDLEYAGERLSERPDLLLRVLLERARRPAAAAREGSGRLEAFLKAAGERRAQAQEALETARLSWRLRDDDNLLLSRVESQLLRAVRAGGARLRELGRLSGPEPGEAQADAVSRALRDGGRVEVPPHAPPSPPRKRGRPRQLIGQPAGPGLAAGRARRVANAEDLGRFQAGEVLVCDAIQPMMTHLVGLAAGIVERRGGMLIHGAIIARELGIPCVNGVAEAMESIEDGELATVDGHLGIVTLGEPELDEELA